MIEKYWQPALYVTVSGLLIFAIIVFKKQIAIGTSAVFAVLRYICHFLFTRIAFVRRHHKNSFHILSAEHTKDWHIHIPLFTLKIYSTPRSLEDPVNWDDPNYDATVQSELQEFSTKLFKHIEMQYELSRERVNIRAGVENGDGEIGISLKVRMPVNRLNRILLGSTTIRNRDVRRRLPIIFYEEWWAKKSLPQ